ncbi:hypothetical protein G7046_g1377 [Stylonectria norvegica]|nr:hypothetical protein G7046_g1377 [Stylonectria norvegica]
MHINVPRQTNIPPDICPPDKNLYYCSGAGYTCCSVNPCENYECPDDHEEKGTGSSSTEGDGASISSTAGAVFITSSDDWPPTTITFPDTTTDSDTMTSAAMTSEAMTDSGTTRTIPNNSRVTVTRKTTIVTDKTPTPQPSTTPTESYLRATIGTPMGRRGGGGFSTGAIAGAAVGGVVVLTTLALIFVFLRRRRRRSKGLGRSRSNATSTGRRSSAEKKTAPQTMSAHTTGTQESGDPFAPFGGRIDRPNDPLRPPSGTFEMDATSSVPVELPATNETVSPVSPRPGPHPPDENPPHQRAGPADPQANLNASLTDRRQNNYVNHWNQYRSLGQEDRRN